MAASVADPVRLHHLFGHLDPQLLSFAKDQWCASYRIGVRHDADQVTHLLDNGRRSGRAALPQSPPMVAEPLAQAGGCSVELESCQGRLPARSRIGDRSNVAVGVGRPQASGQAELKSSIFTVSNKRERYLAPGVTIDHWPSRRSTRAKLLVVSIHSRKLSASHLPPVSPCSWKEIAQITSGLEAGRVCLHRSPRTIPAGCLIQPKHGTYLFKERRGKA
jgi:hypothetical protein